MDGTALLALFTSLPPPAETIAMGPDEENVYIFQSVG